MNLLGLTACADDPMFHVKQAGVALEHFGQNREPDWRIEHRPRGTYYWVVIDHLGETIAHGVRVTLGEAVTEAVKWST